MKGRIAALRDRGAVGHGENVTSRRDLKVSPEPFVPRGLQRACLTPKLRGIDRGVVGLGDAGSTAGPSCADVSCDMELLSTALGLRADGYCGLCRRRGCNGPGRPSHE